MTNWAEKFRMASVYLFLGVMAFVSIFPFAWMVISSTNASVDVTKGKFTFGSALLENFEKLNKSFDVAQVFWNSGKIAIIGGFFTLLISSRRATALKCSAPKPANACTTACCSR